MASGTGNSSWTQLRQQVRSLESQTENHLQTYAQLSSSSSVPAKPTDYERQTETKLQELLEKRDGIIQKLARLLDSDPTLTSSAVKQNNLTLLREKLAEHRKDLTRLQSQLSEARDRANLMAHVRDDINTYRAGSRTAGRASGEGGDRNDSAEATEADYMLGERGRIDHSHNMVDSVLSQAYAVNDSFMLQRETLANINRRITLAASQVPGINTLIGRISTKKRRDGIIMGTFIAFCFVVFWMFL